MIVKGGEFGVAFFSKNGGYALPCASIKKPQLLVLIVTPRGRKAHARVPMPLPYN